ncbi:MAG: bifunctional glutamate N-acetyltransferase/amino-acid acetyltransferase ArgJ [Planctomycetota bacterium]|nr:bifunctional glutamate N-acetyltransferase/amino-acid acetyltransferase ArgJ [Planctomycetota bacterium]
MIPLPEVIHLPRGFSFSSVACGIKKSGKRDLSLLVTDQPAVSLGAFTQNLVRASSVDWNAENIGRCRALVINSGNANACTGTAGVGDTARMAEQVAESLGLVANEVHVMSTGIIGEPLPMEKIGPGIREAAGQLAGGRESLVDFATGMLTTDTFPKVVSKKFTVDDREYVLTGVAKGAGMIGPKMATLLAVVMTDFPLNDSPANRQRFRSVVDRSFNSISVDGHTSTSDQMILVATGGDPGDGSPTELFFSELEEVSVALAKMIPSDGEGAQHLIEIRVTGDSPEEDLRTVARTIADSPLVKTAIFGGDPNWGRIMSAAGYAGVDFDPHQSSLLINGHLLFQNGTPVGFEESAVSQSIQADFETRIDLELCRGGEELAETRYWTSDLTYEYVKINAEYHT